jgi:hypothetical protein
MFTRQIANGRLALARVESEDQIAAMSPEDQAEIRAIQDEWAVQGIEIHPVAKWWGFEIHLNPQACELVADITEELGKMLAKFPKLKPIGPLIKLYCKIRASLIRKVGKDYGCKLVSPWIAPGMLIPISLAPAVDTSLWWTVFGRDGETGASGWNEDQKFPGHFTQASPALAAYKDKLYCVHRGSGGDKYLWWTVYETVPADSETGDTGWSEDRRFPAHLSESGPALATFGDYLYCLHRGAGSDEEIWWTRFNGTSWSPDVKMNASTKNAPALAVHDGKLHVLYKWNKDNSIWYITFNGSSWSQTAKTNLATNADPALAVYRNKLYFACKSSANNKLWFGEYPHGIREMTGYDTTKGPSLAAMGDYLYLMLHGVDNKLWWARWNGSSWTNATPLPNHKTGVAPAIIGFRDQNGTEDQLLCVHRGL